MTKQELDELESRYNKLLREKERQQIRYEEAIKKLKEYGVDKDNLDETIMTLENKISSLESKLDSNASKLDECLTKLEAQI